MDLWYLSTNMNYFEDDDLNNENDENRPTTPTPAPQSLASSQVLGNSSRRSASPLHFPSSPNKPPRTPTPFSERPHPNTQQSTAHRSQPEPSHQQASNVDNLASSSSSQGPFGSKKQQASKRRRRIWWYYLHWITVPLIPSAVHYFVLAKIARVVKKKLLTNFDYFQLVIRVLILNNM